MTSETQRLNIARHKNRLAGTGVAHVHPPVVLKHTRQSEATIRERQSHSLNAAKRSGNRQPSMPKFNLKEEET